jgi:hypothetical protein
MPATRMKAATENASEAKAVASLYSMRLKQVREKQLPVLEAKEAQRKGMTLRDLFRRVGMQTADVAGAIPVADSTLRGIVSGRTQPSLPLPLMNRLLVLLDVSWPVFVAAYDSTLASRAEAEAKTKAAA